MVSTYISDLNTIKEEESEFENESECTPTGFSLFPKTPIKPRHVKSNSEKLAKTDLHFTSLQNLAQSCDGRKKFSENQPFADKMASVWRRAITKGPKSP